MHLSIKMQVEIKIMCVDHVRTQVITDYWNHCLLINIKTFKVCYFGSDVTCNLRTHG